MLDSAGFPGISRSTYHEVERLTVRRSHLERPGWYDNKVGTIGAFLKAIQRPQCPFLFGREGNTLRLRSNARLG